MQYEPSHPAFGELLDVVRSACERSQQVYFTPGDFCYRWHTEITPESPPAARIWTGPDGRAAAFAWLSEGQAHLILRLRSGHVCRPDWTSSEEELLAWAERRYAGSVPGVSGTALTVMALDGDVRRQALLARRGYRQTDLVLVRRSRMLDCPIAAPAFPAGFALEHIPSATFEHHERWAAAYRQAFEPEQMSVALRRAVAAAPLYRPELDLALRAPDGSLAAFALVWFDELTRSGTFEPLGCVPDQRRKGLSAALLREGLRRLRALGATTAFVTTAERRLPANRLYEAAGFGCAASGALWRALR